MSTVDNGVLLTYSYAVSQPGNEGKRYRFKVAAENLLGVGPYTTAGIVLMAVDAPKAPTLQLGSRTITSVNLKFVPDVDNGGSVITGYLLYRDQGVAGSPFTLVYNGTAMPEIIYFNVTDLMTNHYYNFRLYSMNAIYQSATYGSIDLLIGTVPAQPFKPLFVTASLTDFSIKIQWSEPSYIGGLPIQSYQLWIDDGAGVWIATPVTYTPLTPGSTYQYSFTGLIQGGMYQFKIVAVNLVGASQDSEVSYFQCADIPDVPDAPVLETTTATSISVAWNEPLSDGGSEILGYKLFMNDILADDYFNLVYDGSMYPSTLTFNMTGLTPGKYYRFKVSAINRIGESAMSAEGKFLAADFPSAPTQPYLIQSTST